MGSGGNGRTRGRVVIVGAGPGDPELITVKGLRVLQEADVVVYDRLAPKSLLGYAKPGAETIYVGKEPGRHTMSQDEINRLLYELASQGKTVVRLKGGDPYIYGRGEEECIYLVERGVDCQVVPGIPSFIAAAVYAGIPLTSRGFSSSLAVATGTEAREKEKPVVNLSGLAKAADTVVVLMAARRAAQVLREIGEARGFDEPAAVIVEATTPRQEVVVGTIGELVRLAEEKGIRNPAIIVVGKTVKLYEKLRGTGPRAV